MKKKILSLLSVICVLIALFPAVVVNAMTAQEGANWATARIGQGIDTDGYYGFQCKDFVNAYCQQNWGFTPPGNAIDLKDYNYPSGWQKIQNTPDFLPQPGDIAVWAYGSYSTYGHCGIITSANLSTFTSVDQNWYNANGTTGSVAALVTHNYNGFWGVIRPPFDTTEQKVYPIHKDSNAHVRNGFFTFRNISSNKMMQVHGGADENKKEIDMWDFDGSIDQRFNVVHKGGGKYKLYAECSSDGNNRVVDIFRNDGAIAEGQVVDLWTPDDDTAQLFYIWPVSDSEYVFEIAAKDGYVICPKNASAAGQNGFNNGSQLVVQKYTGAAYQKWKLCNNNGKATTPNISYSSGAYKVETDGDPLNVRNGPGTSNSRIGSVPDGAVLSVTEVNGNWGKMSYNGLNGWVCLDFTVYTVVLDSISISKQPNKTSYYVGDKFDSTGLEISANYSNGQKERIGSGFSISGDLSSAGTKTITVSYKGKSATFSVEVKELAINSIFLYSNDITKEYIVGELVISEEIRILVNYNNGTDSIITSGFNVNYDFSTPGTKTVTVSYGGKTTSYDVEVIASDEPSGSASLSVDSQNGYGGSSVTVPIILNATNVYDGNMTIQYDAEKLTIDDVRAVGELSGRQVIINKEFAADKIRVSFSGTTPIDTDKAILNLRFKASANTEGDAAISITEARVYNKAGESISVSMTGGTVRIEAVAGDAEVTNIQSVSKNGKKSVTANVSNDSVVCYLAAYIDGVLAECDVARPSNGSVELSVGERQKAQYKFMTWNMAMKPMINTVSLY